MIDYWSFKHNLNIKKWTLLYFNVIVSSLTYIYSLKGHLFGFLTCKCCSMKHKHRTEWVSKDVLWVRGLMQSIYQIISLYRKACSSGRTFAFGLAFSCCDLLEMFFDLKWSSSFCKVFLVGLVQIRNYCILTCIYQTLYTLYN